MRGQFYQIANFPQVVAAIDCTHVVISNPGGEDSQHLINRKGWHSLNCQFTCDANMIISSVVAHWPGSAHDSRTFNESQLKVCFETGQHQGVLMGDGGYTALPYMLTPLNRPQTGPNRAYIPLPGVIFYLVIGVTTFLLVGCLLLCIKCCITCWTQMYTSNSKEKF